MQKKPKNSEIANQNAESFDFSALKDTFVSLLNETNPFPVDFDEAWEWIGYSRKDHAKYGLLQNFENEVDFHVPNIRDMKKTSRYNPEKIYMTLDCFKSFCMLANTERGKQVRLYYLNLEKEYVVFKNAVLESPHLQAIAPALAPLLIPYLKPIIMKEVQAMKEVIQEEATQFRYALLSWIDDHLVPTFLGWINEHEDRLELVEGMLQNFSMMQEVDSFPAKFYVIQEGDEYVFKLGNSIEAETRIIQLNVGNSKALTVVLTIPFASATVAKSFENHLHEFFHKKRARGEWFGLEEGDLALINHLALLYDAYYSQVWAKQIGG
jgi:phage anti-repressor protein